MAVTSVQSPLLGETTCGTLLQQLQVSRQKLSCNLLVTNSKKNKKYPSLFNTYFCFHIGGPLSTYDQSYSLKS